MSIVYEGFGNVLTHPAQTLTCPVNVVGVMGKGLALSMRNRIDGLYEHYKKLCLTGELHLETCAVYPIPNRTQQVLLLPTKDHWKNNSDVKHIDKILHHLASHYETLNIASLAMIPLGCGLGRLDYMRDVAPLMRKHLDPLPIDVHILHRFR